MKKFLYAVFFALLLSVSTAYANVTEYNVTEEDGTFNISGKVEYTDRNIAIEILKPECDFEDGLETNAAVFIKQMDFGKDENEFSFKFQCSGESGKYNVRLNGENFTEIKEFSVKYIKVSDFSAALEELENSMRDKAEFYSCLDRDNNAFILGCDEIPEEIEAADIRSVFYDLFKEEKDNVSNINDMRRLWNAGVLISAINKGRLTDIQEYEKFLKHFDEIVLKWYDRIKVQDGALKKLTDVLNAQDCGSYDEFDTAVKSALVLTVVKHPNGIGNIGAVLTDFSDVTGITKANEMEKYRKAAGADYSDLKKFLNYFKGLDTEPSGSGGSSGGGSSSSGGGNSAIISSGAAVNNIGVIKMNFTDLDTVPWAYEAISVLTEREVINGRSETRFEPDYSITREEFVKICIKILSLENEKFDIHFNDAGAEEWYSSYVNIAYEKGIVSGMGDGSFGAGQPITRQDMAVILYNSLKTCGYTGDAVRAEFSDSDLINDYAEEAIAVLFNSGAIKGVGNNCFNPLGNATRAEAAKMVFGILDYLN